MATPDITLRTYRGHADNAVLAEIAQRATSEPCTPDRLAYELSMPGINHVRDIAVCEAQGRVIGYGVMSVDDVRDVRQGRLTSRIPDDEPQQGSAARVILLWAARRMQDEIDATDRAVTMVEMVKEEDLERREFLENAGFQTIRYYKVMVLKNPARLTELPLPPEYSYIHGPGHQGAEEYVAMFNETWIDHYGFIPLTVDLYLHDLDDDPDYNPSLDIVLARSDGRFVGFSFCRIEPSDSALGEVMVIGIRRGSRGLGLGRILLTHSVRTLVEHGAERIELVVDSENATGAERLYESVGFGVTSMKRRYQLAQDGIIRLATLDAC
jgi:ribosomal protein S18 acetylase RimI-like enzyme